MKAGLQSNITEKDKFIKVIFLEEKGRDLFASILKIHSLELVYQILEYLCQDCEDANFFGI